MRANPNESLPLPDRDDPILPGFNVTVTIGRNIGEEPMGTYEWINFQKETRDRVERILHDPEFTFEFEGDGAWGDLFEDSASFVFVNVGRWVNRRHLEDVLATLAHDFQQDAIAYHAGRGNLVPRKG